MCTTRKNSSAARAADGLHRPAMRGFVTVRPEGLDDDRLKRWVQDAVARAEFLAPK
jgi:hypothetical protein